MKYILIKLNRKSEHWYPLLYSQWKHIWYFSIGENDCAGVCLNPDAINYDSLAIINDGSCQDFVFGCVDSTALNFNFEVRGEKDDDVSVHLSHMRLFYFSRFLKKFGDINVSIYY